MNQTKLLNFMLNTGSYDTIVDTIIALSLQRQSSVICVANVYMFAEAQKNKDFLNIINNADMVTPDGKPLCWALQILNKIEQPRVAGMDLLPDLLRKLAKQSLSVYFYGGSHEMLAQAKLYIRANYPGLTLAGAYSPPFRELSPKEETEIISNINECKPNIVFVILGCPKQEKWMHRMKDKINCVMIGVGGALPVMIGQQKRAPVWMQNAGFEWFYRLMQAPGRLFKRYAVTNSIFMWLICKEWFRLKMTAPAKIFRY